MNGKKENAKIMNCLMEYYAEFWPWHATEVIHDDSKNAIELQRKIDRLFSSKENYTTWLEFHNHDHNLFSNTIPKRITPQPLYYASLLGLESTVKMLLQTQINTLGILNTGQFGNPLNAAAIRGNFKILKRLLEHFSGGRNFGSIIAGRREN